MPAPLRIVCALVVFLVAGLSARSVHAQDAVYNQCVLSWEDGEEGRDDDGVKDGTLTFGAGTTHVIDDCHFYGTERLVIEPGAVVKVAGECTHDEKYKVQKCEPITYCCWVELWAYGGDATIEIDGATITDVRDNSVGATIPIDGDPGRLFPSYAIRFNKNTSSTIKNSTIKYVGEMTYVGNMQITGNTFLYFGGIRDENSDVVINAAPVITDNVFELAYPSSAGGRIDLRGKSPLFSGNTVRSVLIETPSTPAGSNVSTTGLLIGPSGQNMGYRDQYPWGPVTGKTVVWGNHFETTTGVEMEQAWRETDKHYEKVNFRASIQNNTFRGTSNPAKDTPGGTALKLMMAGDVEVTGNEISNYLQAFAAHTHPIIKKNGLRIHNNRFSVEGSASNSASFGGDYSNGLFVNAENNYWGDPSGPLDKSKLDGLHNPRGKGVLVADGVDYVPFIGGTPEYTDDIHLLSAAYRIFENDEGDTERKEETEFAVGDSVEIEMVADFIRFRSAEKGKVVAHLLDPAGNIVLSSEPVAITAEDTAVEIPSFGLTIPDGGAFLELQAVLLPEDEDTGEPSNVIRYAVTGLRSAFSAQLRRASDSPIQGVAYTDDLDIDYTLSTAANGTFEVTIQQRRRGTNPPVVLNSLFNQTISAAPGKDQKVSLPVHVTFPIPAAPTKTDYFFIIKMKDDQGKVLVERSQSGNISSPGQVTFGNRRDEDDEVDEDLPSVFPAAVQGSSVVKTGQTYFRPGDDVAANVSISWRIRTPGVTNWTVDLDRVESLGAGGSVIEAYSTGVKQEPIPTTIDWNTTTLDMAAVGKKVPTGAAKLRFHARLMNGAQLIAEESVDVEVRMPEATETASVPAGTLKAAFSLVGTELAFTTNTSGGTVTSERFAGVFGSSELGKASDYSAWQLIPLNRYWTVFGTLPEGSYQGRVSFTYDPARDFPAAGGFSEDSLVVSAFNPLSGELEVLPSQLDKSARTVSADYTTFFETYVVASKNTVVVQTAISAAEELPDGYALDQNYPNPFNPATTFTFRLPVTGEATLKVYNLLGQEVAVLVEGAFPAGTHRVEWDGRDAVGAEAASGVYLVRLTAGRFSQVRKTILVR